jgi:hypothetical protein
MRYKAQSPGDVKRIGVVAMLRSLAALAAVWPPAGIRIIGSRHYPGYRE